MTQPITATYVATRNLYGFLPAAYMSFLDHHPGAEVYVFIEDPELPYDVPDNVFVIDGSKQTVFTEENCANWKTGFKPLTMLRACWAKLFTGEENDLGIQRLPLRSKIFQFDVDTTVLENLTPVYELDMTDVWFAAVQEYLSVHKPRPTYWNLGFGLIGLDAMRKDGIADYMIADLKWIEYPWLDQDVLCRLGNYNRDKEYDLGIRYNSCSQTGFHARPAIVHQCAQGRNKFTREDVPYIDLIRKYRDYYEIEACTKAGYETHE